MLLAKFLRELKGYAHAYEDMVEAYRALGTKEERQTALICLADEMKVPESAARAILN